MEKSQFSQNKTQQKIYIFKIILINMAKTSLERLCKKAFSFAIVGSAIAIAALTTGCGTYLDYRIRIPQPVPNYHPKPHPNYRQPQPQIFPPFNPDYRHPKPQPHHFPQPKPEYNPHKPKPDYKPEPKNQKPLPPYHSPQNKSYGENQKPKFSEGYSNRNYEQNQNQHQPRKQPYSNRNYQQNI